jgi:hypothetical protein
MVKISAQKEQKVIDECRKNMGSWYAYFADNIQRFRDNKRFYNGQQWDPEVQYDYISQQKPALVFNFLSQFVTKLQGEQRNADFTPLPIPKDDTVNPKEVDFMSGLMMNIMDDSDARDQYGSSFRNQLVGGWGVLKARTDYESETTFDQKVIIESDEEPINYFFDPFAKSKFKTDGDFCGRYELMSKEEFKKQYPNAKYPDSALLPTQAPQYPVPTDRTAVIVEYYRRERKNKTLVLLTNNINFKRECYIEDKEQTEQEYYAQMESMGMPLIAIPPLEEAGRRNTFETHIRCYKLTALEVLDVYDWPGKTKLPYIFVDGDSMSIDGIQYVRSFIENAKDMQRFTNYVWSEIAYSIKTSRRERILLTAKQMEGYQDMWRRPEQTKGALLYKTDPGAPPPIRFEASEVPQTLFMAATNATNSITQALGMLDPVTGGLPNAASGVAVQRTLNQQNLSVVNYVQNLYDAMTELGRIVLEIIPNVYDTERTVTVYDKDKKAKRAKINTFDEFAQPVNHIDQLSEVIHDFKIVAGASFASQKEMTLEFLMQLFQNPQVGPLIADLIPKELELSIAPELEERMEFILPPAVLAKKNGQPPPPPTPPQPTPEQIQMQMKQMDIQSQMQMNEQKNAIEQRKLAMQEADMQLDANKAQLQAYTELQTAHMDERAEIFKAIADLHKSVHEMNTKLQAASKPASTTAS